MNYTDKLKHVSVLGAAGKMGSGITLLAAIELTDQRLKNPDKQFVLNAIDVSNKALTELTEYIRKQALRVAEKKLKHLREIWTERKDLVQNSDMVQEYIFEVLKTLRTSTRMETAYDSTLIFEAVSENRALKVKLFSEIDKNNQNSPWFFTNTSSIPINEIEKEAKVNGRLVGFHFYNPPAVQKLVELITTNETSAQAKEFALQLAKNMRKVIVASNDFAGFIGNGHFMRDALYAFNKVEELTVEMSLEEAIYVVNKISQEYLIRPMGIFQLIDYVGGDVVQFILNVMNPYNADENLHSDLLDKFTENEIIGGQYSNGKQKDGILKYQKSKPVAVYSLKKGEYVAFAEFAAKCDEKLGKLPTSTDSWKNINFSKQKQELLKKYFEELNSSKTLGAKLAKNYLKVSKKIGLKLVTDKVANSKEDVNKVMLTGFYHAYGPVNDYV